MQKRNRSNAILLKGLCAAIPAAALIGAHWFPWRRLIHRDLYRLETYAIGTATIVGTASAAIALSEGERDDHVVMLNLAAGSAGVATIAAYIIDAFISLYGEVANLKAQKEALDPYKDARGDRGDL